MSSRSRSFLSRANQTLKTHKKRCNRNKTTLQEMGLQTQNWHNLFQHLPNNKRHRGHGNQCDIKSNDIFDPEQECEDCKMKKAGMEQNWCHHDCQNSNQSAKNSSIKFLVGADLPLHWTVQSCTKDDKLDNITRNSSDICKSSISGNLLGLTKGLDENCDETVGNNTFKLS